MEPLVSVVIPLYNKEAYIENTINSILAQTLSDFEIIVVNDGSTDRSLEIVKSINDSRIRIITQTNHGLSATRNRGIREANTELIAFLDADDTWGSLFLETIYRLYTKYPNAGFFGTAFSVYSGDNLVRHVVHEPENGDRIFSSYFGEWEKAGHPIIIASGFAARKSALMRVDCYRADLRAGQDHDLFGKIALYYDVAYSPDICLTYNIGTTNNGDRVNYVIEVPLMKYLSANHNDNFICNMNDLHKYLNHWKIRTGGRNVYSGFRKEGRKQILLATSAKFSLLKLIFLLMSYLPVPLEKISPNKVRSILRVFELSI